MYVSCEFDHLQDVHSSTWFMFICGIRWFSARLDWIVVIYLACVILSFLFLGSEGRPSGMKCSIRIKINLGLIKQLNKKRF